MKNYIATLAIFAMAQAITLSSWAQGGGAILQLQGTGGAYTVPVNPQGNTTIFGVRPGNYQVGMLLPAVQKIREAAAKPSSASQQKVFEIKDFSFGVENPTTIGSATGGAGAGKIKFNEFTIKKTSDAASPALQKVSVAGMQIPLTQKTQYNGQEYYIVKLTDVLISSVQSSSSSGESRPMESLSLNFTKISYKVQQ